MEMVPFLIGKITWHLPGGRYHSPSIITAHRRWGHSHQRLYQCRARKWPMDIFLRRSASLSSHRDRPPLFSDVHCPTDLPECLPPGRYRARLRRLEAERHSQRQQVSRRGRESVLHASCDTRRYGDDAGGHRPSRAVAGAGWSRREVAEHLGLKLDTLRKAFQQGRLTEPGPLEPGAAAPDKAAALQPPIATDRSTRAVEDAAAEMGTACTRPDQRVLAAFGLLDGAPTHFEPC